MKRCQWILIERLPHDSCNQASTFCFYCGRKEEGKEMFQWGRIYAFSFSHSSLQQPAGLLYNIKVRWRWRGGGWWLNFSIRVQPTVWLRMRVKWFVGCLSSELQRWWESWDEVFMQRYTCLISLITIWASNRAECQVLSSLLSVFFSLPHIFPGAVIF